MSSDQYHLSMKSIGRKAGRSATAAAAYRAGALIVDQRTGEVHDYRRKRGVAHTHLVLPGGGTMARNALWNAVELKHKRGDAVLVREIEVALPLGLNSTQRQTLIEGYAAELADMYQVAVDVAIHAPHPVTDADLKRDPNQFYVEEDEVLANGKTRKRRHNGNWHAHVSMSACHVSTEGVPGKKCLLLDEIHCQRAKELNAATVQRPRWAALANAALAAAGALHRIDHRSYQARGIARAPTRHRGPAATAVERQTGEASRRRLADAQRVAAEQAELDALRDAQADVEAAVAALAADEATLAAEIGAAGALVHADAAPSVDVPASGPLASDAQAAASAADQDAAVDAPDRAAARAAAPSAPPAPVPDALPRGAASAPGVAVDRSAGRVSDTSAARSRDAPHVPLQERGQPAGVPPPAPQAAHQIPAPVSAPVPAPGVPLAVQLSRAQARAKARQRALLAAEAQQGVQVVSTALSAQAAADLQSALARLAALREERNQLRAQITARGVGARLIAVVHDPQQMRIDGIDAELLQGRSVLNQAKAAVALAGPVPTVHDQHEVQAELRRLRAAVQSAEKDVQAIERAQLAQAARERQQSLLDDFDHDHDRDYDRDR